ncbi:E3 ubiquitin-protein ligase MARCHF4-like [Myxocyprinus asiaticus]|uniref:E3 ubiquitin-protein ligase MARCHF4-like n=1 Tax=Myxocyprinus asiaticus TaxID=70543 RepID=UPI0022236778|nr:E3 ubiquitin-protein ligase MARCHF4-like [Myxocyprinus asiaticus]
MLLAIGVIVWCWGLLSRRPMLRRQGKQKVRCCVLLSDLKVFLLRPPAPSASPSALTPMNELNAEDNATSSATESNSLANGHYQPAGWTPTGEAEDTRENEDWTHNAVDPPRTLDCCSSSEDCSKEKLDERLSLNSSTDSGVRTPLCRICFQGPEQGELLSPCRCSGSVRCTHEPCLIKWISERGSWSCELCYYKYQVIAISTKNPLQWQAISLTVIEKVQIAAAILGSLFLIASISWLVWSSLSPSARWQRQDLLFQICYAMYGFMDLVCIALIVHEGPSVFRIFNRWQAVNQQWKVLNYDKVKDNEEHQKTGATFRTLTLPLTHCMGPTGMEGESSTSLMAAAAVAAAPTVAPTANSVPLPTGATMEAQDSSEPSNGQPLLPDHHCAYNILHLFSHHVRHQEPRGQSSNNNRELVMRVTTV